MSKKPAFARSPKGFEPTDENAAGRRPATTLSETRWCVYIPWKTAVRIPYEHDAGHRNSHRTRRSNATKKELNIARKQPESSPVPSGHEGPAVDSNLPAWYR